MPELRLLAAPRNGISWQAARLDLFKERPAAPANWEQEQVIGNRSREDK